MMVPKCQGKERGESLRSTRGMSALLRQMR